MHRLCGHGQRGPRARLIRKVERARTTVGTSFLHVLAPCPTGWGIETSETLEVARGAVRLWRMDSGRVRSRPLSHQQDASRFKPVADHLATQKRFAHLGKADVLQLRKSAIVAGAAAATGGGTETVSLLSASLVLRAPGDQGALHFSQADVHQLADHAMEIMAGDHEIGTGHLAAVHDDVAHAALGAINSAATTHTHALPRPMRRPVDDGWAGRQAAPPCG